MTDKEEKAVERCNQLIKVEHANWIGISNQVAIETVLNLIQAQDKIIDEMAKYIASLDMEEDICVKNVANTELCNEEYSNCKECVKEHFINKVDKENKDE